MNPIPTMIDQAGTDRACKALWASVMRQAILDLRAGFVEGEKARYWFLSDATGPGSFLFICLNLNLDPEKGRNSLGPYLYQRAKKRRRNG